MSEFKVKHIYLYCKTADPPDSCRRAGETATSTGEAATPAGGRAARCARG